MKARLLASGLLLSTFVLGAQETELPENAANAREIFAREIERGLVPLRSKYNRALENMKRGHTRAGKLEAALQIDEELKRSRNWKGLPIPTDQAENMEPTLPEDAASVRGSYAREVERVLDPLRTKYIAALESMKLDDTRDGKLEAALQVDGELKRAKNWEDLPLPTVKIADSKEDFGEWLVGKEFSFSGVSQVTLLFGEDSVTWTTGGGTVKEHTYDIDTKRTLTVEGAQDFKLRFSDDLTSGTFSSNVGTYDLKFGGEQE